MPKVKSRISGLEVRRISSAVFGVSGRFPWRLRSVRKVLSQMNDTTVYLYADVLVAGMLWVVVMSEMERPMAERPFGFSMMYFFTCTVQCTMYKDHIL